jgi:hypothetical protein
MVEEILKKIGCSRRHLNHMLLCERNASKKLAMSIEKEVGIPKEVFVFGSQNKRRTEWSKALRRMEK